MGLIAENQYIENNESPNNRIKIRLNTSFKLQPDVKTFPLYCNACNRVQPILYVHCGSRYGQVGSCACHYCKNTIAVTDGDNIVTYIRTNERELRFKELYLLDWNYIEQLAPAQAQLIAEALRPYEEEYITVYQLCSIVENTLDIKQYTVNKYITDKEYCFLPQDINQWISLLDAAKIKLPDYVRKY